MNYDHNKKFGLLNFFSAYGKFNLNSPKGYSLKIINAETDEHGKLISKMILSIGLFKKLLKDVKTCEHVLQILTVSFS